MKTGSASDSDVDHLCGAVQSAQDPFPDDYPKEECGVIGIFAPNEEASRIAFFALFALQHRGQESAGMAVSDGETVKVHREMGLVNQVFHEDTLKEMPGHMAIGHTRYSTTGVSEKKNAQPVYCVTSEGEVAVAHNGNLVNTAELRAELEAEGEVFSSSSDSELIARLLARNLEKGPEEAVREVMRRVVGAYAVTAISPRWIVGFRDPNGIRPLCLGKVGEGYILASESCAFPPVSAEFEREVGPGEIVVIDSKGPRSSAGAPSPGESLCLFEFIYFARPDSHMFNTSIYTARSRMGARLAIEHPADADLVIPVPDSGIPAALGYARQSGIPFGEGMTKSRYIQRTFIAPDQRMRELGVRMKLTPLPENIAGKRLVLVDDSIVRGTTTRQIVKLLFDSGAAEVHVRITAPPIQHPCYYGIDMPVRSDLASATMSNEELCEHVGATSLGFLSIAGAVESVGAPGKNFCLACFSGDYPIQVDYDVRKDLLEAGRVGEISAVSGGQLLLLAD